MALTVTSGGSLTTAMVLTLVAWGIRALRGPAAKRILDDVRKKLRLNLPSVIRNSRGEKALAITPSALKVLVRDRPLSFVILGVISEERRSVNRKKIRLGSYSSSSSSSSLGDADATAQDQIQDVLGSFLTIPASIVRELFIFSCSPLQLSRPASMTSRGSWASRNNTLRRRVGSTSSLTGSGAEYTNNNNNNDMYDNEFMRSNRLAKSDLVVLLAGSDDDRSVVEIRNLTSFGCELGYRCVYVEGGTEGVLGASSRLNPQADATPHVPSISRDAIIYLYTINQYKHAQNERYGVKGRDYGGGGGGGARGRQPMETYILDIRRHDELSLYGTIRGARHLPGNHLPHALTLKNDEWRSKYGFNKPGLHDVVIVLCNTGIRSKWVAHLFLDYGYVNVLHDSQGTNSWHLDPNLDVYQTYDLAEGLPDPVPFEVDEISFEKGRADLERMGMLHIFLEQASTN